MATVKLGELLLKANIINEGQLKAALGEQQKWGGKLGEILVRMNFCSEEILVKALSKQLGIQRADLDNLPPIPPQVLRKIAPATASEMNVLPLQLRDEGKTLVVAVADPLNIETTDTLRSLTGCKIIPLIAGASALARLRAQLYGGEEELDSSAGAGFKVTDAQGRTIVKNLNDLKAQAAKPPPPPTGSLPPPTSQAGQSPQEILGALEAVQRKEVAALKAMVELLIEKGVFTRDEYLARVKR